MSYTNTLPPPLNFYSARLVTICLLYVDGHFPQEGNDDSLPWLLYKSFFYAVDRQTKHSLPLSKWTIDQSFL